MSIYKDINLTLEKNIYNDIGIISDGNAIKNTLINNLLLDKDEIPFDNTSRLDITSLVHNIDDILVQNFIKNAVDEAIQKDNRIIELKEISFEFLPNDYSAKITIKIDVDYNRNESEEIDLTLIIKGSN